MKKSWIVLWMAVILACMLTGCGNGENVVKEEGTLSQKYIQYMKNNKYYMKYKGAVEGKEIVVDMVIDGTNMAMLTSAEDSKAGLILKDGYMYVIDHTNKTILKAPSNPEQTTPNFEFVEKGEATFQGEKMKYEEYKSAEDEAMRFFFHEDATLAGIETITDSGSSNMEIMEFKEDYPTELFEIPTDYTVQDLSGAE